MLHKQEFSYTELLAGLWTFLAMFEAMKSYSPQELAELKKADQQFF
ncbi:hypothetical protein [Methylocucumis oryzae]|nr:hypothetical protein [Methylocucumis oryzae]